MRERYRTFYRTIKNPARGGVNRSNGTISTTFETPLARWIAIHLSRLIQSARVLDRSDMVLCGPSPNADLY